jgi:hypothetical protein
MNEWFSVNSQTIKDNGFGDEVYKVSSWAMVVDINFKATAPAFYSAVQHGKSRVAKSTDLKVGDGCVPFGSEHPETEYCLTEDATTNSLAGVCDKWRYECGTNGTGDCGDQVLVKCFDWVNMQDATNTADTANCYTL